MKNDGVFEKSRKVFITIIENNLRDLDGIITSSPAIQGNTCVRLALRALETEMKSAITSIVKGEYDSFLKA